MKLESCLMAELMGLLIVIVGSGIMGESLAGGNDAIGIQWCTLPASF